MSLQSILQKTFIFGSSRKHWLQNFDLSIFQKIVCYDPLSRLYYSLVEMKHFVYFSGSTLLPVLVQQQPHWQKQKQLQLPQYHQHLTKPLFHLVIQMGYFPLILMTVLYNWKLMIISLPRVYQYMFI